ncbi:SRPBCC domain-containing protein [Pedobacter heparinus]|uniref:SRPBCC family protein n=1 Tax=Pedobacter heparinus TaxID=984 RepID=UPI00292CD4F6|nr:SRPBCC domain-containing protein [Pedobacter heparinus]
MEQSKKELFITHLFDAPREIVFKAWTNPDQLKHWYAPDGCTIEFKAIDVKVNGSFHSCIYDPVHGQCWIKGIYKVVDFPEKLVFSMILSNEKGEDVRAATAGKPEDWPEELLTTVTFTAIGKQTKLAIHQTVSEEEAKQTGAYQSWIKMFNKLNALITAK